MLKMLDTATGEVLLAERIEGQAEQSDRMVQADAYRNVPEDPLELPSESALLEAAANSAIAQAPADAEPGVLQARSSDSC